MRMKLASKATESKGRQSGTRRTCSLWIWILIWLTCYCTIAFWVRTSSNVCSDITLCCQNMLKRSLLTCILTILRSVPQRYRRPLDKPASTSTKLRRRCSVIYKSSSIWNSAISRTAWKESILRPCWVTICFWTMANWCRSNSRGSFRSFHLHAIS